MSEIQAILFDRNYWTLKEAHTWLNEHSFYPIKRAHQTNQKIRFRLECPKKYRRFRTKRLTSGIELILGFK